MFQLHKYLLKNRSKPPIKDIGAYRDVFGFTAIDYYRCIGFDFDKEPFEIPAAEFIELYHSDESRFRLFDGVTEELAKISAMGIKQAVLSASELHNLLSQIKLLGVEQFFDDIIGISNIYAESKVNIAKTYIADKKLDMEKILLIGDTIHDFDVANTLCIDCVLIANGHRNREKLLDCGVPVLFDIADILEMNLLAASGGGNMYVLQN